MPDQAEPKESPNPLSLEEVKHLYRDLQGVHSGRNSEYATAREMYNGDHWGQPGLVVPETSSKRYTLTVNYIRPTVDKSVQLLLGQMPAIQVMPPGVDQNARDLAEAMEALLYHAWEYNDAPVTLRRIAFNMLLTRRGLAYYWWDSKAKKPRFRSIAPDNFYPLYDGEEIVECVIVSRRHTRTLKRLYPGLADKIFADNDGDDVFDENRFAAMAASAGDPLNQNSAGYDQSRDPISMMSQTTVLDWFDRYGNHVRVMGDAYFKQRVDYGLNKVPVIEFPYNTPGDEREPRSEINDLMDLNLYLDDLLSDAANVIRKFAHPTVLDKGSGVAPATIASALQREGGIIPIRKDGDIEFLNWQGTPADFPTQFDRVQNMIYDISGKPPASYGQTQSNQSGVATNMALSPTTSSNEERTSLFGHHLSILNEAILAMYEKFMKGEEIDVRGRKPKRAGVQQTTYYKANIRGSQIDGWYYNRIRWPSALRTDDPVFVQNELAKLQSSPPAQSVYTTLENLGMEDSEMELDRIKEQLEDPRMHPDVMKAGVDAATALSANAMPTGMEGLDPQAGAGTSPPPGLDPEAIDNNARAAGSPHAEQLTETGY